MNPFHSGEIFILAQITPLSDRQMAQRNAADAHPLQADDLQADRLAHAPDLTFPAFTQHETQLIFVLPADLAGTKLLLSLRAPSLLLDGE